MLLGCRLYHTYSVECGINISVISTHTHIPARERMVRQIWVGIHRFLSVCSLILIKTFFGFFDVWFYSMVWCMLGLLCQNHWILLLIFVYKRRTPSQPNVCVWKFHGRLYFFSNLQPPPFSSVLHPPSCNLLHWAKLHCNHSKLEYIIACRLNLCWRESARQNWPSRWLFHLIFLPEICLYCEERNLKIFCVGLELSRPKCVQEVMLDIFSN